MLLNLYTKIKGIQNVLHGGHVSIQSIILSVQRSCSSNPHCTFTHSTWRVWWVLVFRHFYYFCFMTWHLVSPKQMFPKSGIHMNWLCNLCGPMSVTNSLTDCSGGSPRSRHTLWQTQIQFPEWVSYKKTVVTDNIKQTKIYGNCYLCQNHTKYCIRNAIPASLWAGKCKFTTAIYIKRTTSTILI